MDFNALIPVLDEYEIPRGNLIYTEDVAAHSVKLGWEKHGEDTDKNRIAKIKSDIVPPKILIKENVDWDYALGIAKSIHNYPKERLEPIFDKEWFMNHTILHEIGHYALSHHLKGIEYYQTNDPAEIKLIQEREADRWALDRLEALNL